MRNVEVFMSCLQSCDSSDDYELPAGAHEAQISDHVCQKGALESNKNWKFLVVTLKETLY